MFLVVSSCHDDVVRICLVEYSKYRNVSCMNDGLAHPVVHFGLLEYPVSGLPGMAFFCGEFHNNQENNSVLIPLLFH
jgi:hypothetical protein